MASKQTEQLIDPVPGLGRGVAAPTRRCRSMRCGQCSSTGATSPPNRAASITSRPMPAASRRCGRCRKAAPRTACCCARMAAATSSARCTRTARCYGHIAKAIGCRALIVHYRRAPENVHPGPVNDMATAYRWLLDQGISAAHIALTGDSAGGGLAVTTLLRAREQGLPMPAATMPLSPWLDMEASGETFETNRDKDVLVAREIIQGMAGDVPGRGRQSPGPARQPAARRPCRAAADVHPGR